MSIAAIGFSGQMHGSTLLDGKGDVVRPALLWCDQRTDAQCREITETIGAGTPHRADAESGAHRASRCPSCCGCASRSPTLWARVRSVLLPKDYVRFRLTGAQGNRRRRRVGHAAVRRRRSARGRTRCCASSISIRRCCPKCSSRPRSRAACRAEGAAATGLKVGTPVVAGGGDQAAGAVGMGIVRPGAVSATIGTSGVVFAATDRPALERGGRVHTFCHAVPGTLARHGRHARARACRFAGSAIGSAPARTTAAIRTIG